MKENTLSWKNTFLLLPAGKTIWVCSLLKEMWSAMRLGLVALTLNAQKDALHCIEQNEVLKLIL